MTSKYIKEFREKLEKQPRERLLEIIEEQHPEFIPQIKRIEYVFENKLSHLNWNDGSPVKGRPLTNEELALLIDPPFKPDPDLTAMGIDLNKQKEVHIASDVVLWAREHLKANPRAYQVLILRDSSLRIVLRLGRRLGKTYSMAIRLLHYAITTRNGRCLVMAPMKSQVSLIFEECLKLAKQGDAEQAITRAVQSPQHEIHTSTGSTIRFFTTGMRSGGRSDVARGQEAHIIILDEMDYMGVDDLDALYAMLQKTDENQPDKLMIGASTPSGRRERFHQWCFKPGTKILTDVSWKNIEDISIGDRVLDAYGRIDNVSALFAREYNGDMISLKPHGSTALVSTEEHPHMIRRDGVMQFMPANEVRPGDYLVIPKWKVLENFEDDVPQRLESYKIYDEKYDQILPLIAEGWTKKKIAEHIGVDRRTIFHKLKQLSDNGTFCDPRRLRTVEKAKSLYSRIRDLSDLSALGLYLAEGHITKSNQNGRSFITGVSWAFHHEEQHLIDICINFANKLGFRSRLLYKKDIDSTTLVEIDSAALGLLFQAMFLEKKDKRVPLFIFEKPWLSQKSFLDGVMWGDGNDRSDIGKGTSLQLTAGRACFDMQQIYFQNDLKAKVRRFDRGGSCYYSIRHSANRYDSSGHFYMGMDELWAYVPVAQVEREPYSGIVYNFETANTHTYLAEGYATHNCHQLAPDGTRLPDGLAFKEFWFPALVNPLWDKKIEQEMRSQYSENVYRHEIEADWGEDAEGVYPRRYVDDAFLSPGWKYVDARSSARSDFVIGVDWDKYGAGPNILVLEICSEDYEDERFANKLRVAYRQEIPKNEYVLSQAVGRVMELNEAFQPKHIYIDRGYGEVQYELLMKHGVENPHTKLKERVKGISFGGTIEIRDPATKQWVKKDTKPYMVENLRTLLEKGEILFPESDEELYLQLVSYVVLRLSAFGKPVFGSSGSQVDHAHDALALACLAYIDNYGDFNKVNLARYARSISHNLLLPTMSDEDAAKKISKAFEPVDYPEDKTGSPQGGRRRRNLAAKSVSYSRSISRKSF